MRKLFLTFVMALLCNVVSFAQSDTIPINSAEDFLKIGKDPNYPVNRPYKQTADIDLGDIGDGEKIEDAIISTEFKGTYDGRGYTITYQAHFNGTTEEGDYGLFSTVSGTIKNLNVDADITFSGTEDDMQVGLLCGYLTYLGVVESCNVSGNINSTVQAGNGGGTDAGLVVGECAGGTIKYCNAIGNVTGVGYVGGIVGQMSNSTVSTGFFQWETFNPTVLGCSFVGSVTANNPNETNSVYKGSFAGGICGFANSGATINLCYVNADITSVKQTNGVASTNAAGNWGIPSGGSPTVTNNYAEGTVNGQPINDADYITNSAGNTNHNYYPGGSTQNGGTEMNSQQIAKALNDAANAAGESENIHFSPVGGSNVIFGQVSTESVCEAPTNLTITNNEGTYTATWTSANADNTITEATWHWSLTGGNAYEGGADTSSVSVNLGTLPASPNPYTFTVYTDCSAFDTENSQSVSSTFTVDCPTPTGLTASKITDNSFIISWTANVDCQLTVNGNTETILAGNTMKDTIPGLEPETQYTAIVEAKCGNEYVEQASINVTTARLAAPTGLAVNTVWNGSEESGTATITWDTVVGLTYETVDLEGDTVTAEKGGFAIEGLGEGNYTLRLRAKKGTKTSDWVSMPYTISSPDAPKKPQVTYTINENGNTYDVTVRWSAGSTENDGWIVNGGEVQQDTSYVLYAQTPGDVTTLSIVEKVDLSTSGALQVPIQVPCLDASRPTSIEPALNSVTFNFDPADEKTRKIVIGMQDTTTNATSVTINGLTEGTSYACEIREYCNVATNTYSSIDTTFSTLACYAVAGLSVSNIELTTATVSWTSQSSIDGLQYKVVVNEGDSTIKDSTIQNTTITLTGLTPATTYTVRVSEQCGTEGNWGEERTITFTTESSNYVTANDGVFDFPDTWEENKVPTGKFGNITIKHNVKLSHSLTLSGSCRISNEGVLKITSQGELINTTGNNVGGIIEVETPYKTIDQWTFIGAPFAGYLLEAVKPVSGSDIAMVKYNYTNGAWNSNWATINTPMEAAEGTFAWPFYGGVVTFTTYGDVIGNEYNYSQLPKYALNNDTVIVSKPVVNSEGGYWMALSNPYPAKLRVSKFFEENKSRLQGGVTYVFYDNSGFDILTPDTNTNIDMTQGFFVNLKADAEKKVVFTKSQLTNWPTPSSKSEASPREFIELTLVNGKDKVRVYFAHNEDAEQGYDILDANKMFATTGVAEPYFVTDGIALIKEEVRDLPYYATMNVRSQEDTVMNFVLTNLPEGYAVSIIDGEEVIDLVEGGVYSTEIASGENADRFKVLVKKNVGLADVEELDVRITNSNRHITITAQENVKVSVYNTLGQKVFETEETNFVLSGVASGAYVVKVQGAKASKSQKIVVE